MLLSLARLQLLAFWRAPYLGGRLALAFVKGIGVLYAVGTLAVIGFVWPDLMGVVAPEYDPLRLVEVLFLPALAGLTVVRFVFQEVPTRAATAYLLLPISRERVGASVLARSLASPLNLVPLAFMVPWAARAVRLESGADAAWMVGGAALGFVWLSHLLFVIWKTRLGAHPARTVLGVGAVVALVAMADLAMGGLLTSVREGAMSPRGPALLAVLVAGLAIAGGVAYTCLVASLYLDGVRARARRQPDEVTGFEAGGTGAFVDLDRRLIARTPFPRGVVGNAAVVSIALTVAALLIETGVPPDLVLIFSTGTLAGSLGQFSLPFASGFMDRLITLPGAFAQFVRAKWATVALGTLVLGAVQFVVVLALAPAKAWLVGVSVLFSLGVLAPAALWGSTLGPKPIDVSERLAFNYKAQSFGAQILVAATAVVAGLLIAVAGPALGAAMAGGLGALGLLTSPLWLAALERRIRRRRHKLADRFRGAL